MRGGLVVAVMAGLLAGCSARAPAPPAAPSALLKPMARPGDVVAAELAFARLSAEKGIWASFRTYADKAGVMFVPQKVNAQTWLKGRAEPKGPLTWEPYEVWSSCDGSIGVTRGAYQWGTDRGWFTTVWKRQADGTYRWLLDHSDSDAKIGKPPELIEAHVAECHDGPLAVAMDELPVVTPGEGEFFGGASDDGTLRWGGRVDKWGGRIVTVDVWNGAQFQRVLHQSVAPPAPSPAPATPAK